MAQRRFLLTLADRLMHRPAVVFVLGVFLEVTLLTGIMAWEAASGERTTVLPGVVTTLVATTAAVLAGPRGGALVAFFGMVAFYTVAHLLAVPHSLIAGAVSTVLVSGVAWIAGTMAREIRRERRERDAQLVGLYHAEREVAQALQQGLQVEPAVMPWVELGHLYHSATQAALVGGDFYDVFPVGRKLGLVIGDVAGHGVRAAVLASLIRELLAAELRKEADPERALASVNTALLLRLGEGPMATAFAGIIDRRERTLSYSTAGHPPPVVRTPNGEIQRLECGSLPLAVVPDPRFAGGVHHDVLGSLLVLFTDGVTECRRGDELFGEERLQELVSQAHCHGAADFPEQLNQALLGFTGGSFSDDFAVVAVCVH